MVAKKRNFEMKTILSILIVLLIAAAIVYYVLTPKDEGEEDVLIEQLRLNQDYWDGKTVSVTGLYQLKDNNRPALTPPTTDADPTAEDYVFLDFDTNDINLTETSPFADQKYRVKGVVEVSEEGFATQIEIIVESFKKV